MKDLRPGRIIMMEEWLSATAVVNRSVYPECGDRDWCLEGKASCLHDSDFPVVVTVVLSPTPAYQVFTSKIKLLKKTITP